MENFREFLQAILTVFLPKPKKKRKLKKMQPGGLSIKADEFLIDGKPFRFKKGVKR